jgi:hypothetical protein
MLRPSESFMGTVYGHVKLTGLCFDFLSFVLLASTSAFTQGNARVLVSKMVDNELDSQKHPRYWMYLDNQSKAAKREIDRILQMPECWFTWPVSINGHSPTAQERKHARAQLEELVKNADARKKNREKIDEDSRKSAALLKMLPDAFLFTEEGPEGNSIRLTFRPNPKYKPSSNEAKVFHRMQGVLLVDAKQTRLIKLKGELVSDVDFGFGILGKLKKGGTFEVMQSEVAPQDWEVSLLDVHISGRALFFHTIGEQQHEVRWQFKPVPSGLSLAQAASMLTDGWNQASSVEK